MGPGTDSTGGPDANTTLLTCVPPLGMSNHPDFVGIIPILLENPDQCAIGIDKIPISIRVVIFSSNSHKRKRDTEYLTLMSRKPEETARNIK